MLKYQFLLITVLLALTDLIQGQNITTGNNTLDEESARNLMQRIDDVYWKSATAYRRFADDTLSPEILMREKLREFYDTMQKYDWKNFNDPLLKRQFQVILRGASYPPIDHKFKRATQLLKGMSRRKWVCKREEPQKCKMAFVHQIKTIFTNSDNLNEIKYYWREWRNKLPLDVIQAFHYYIDYYRNLTVANETASKYWYDQYEDTNFLTELEGLMETIGPFYREMHAHLRHVLRIKYGKDIIPPTGLIPHHLMEQVTYQSWKKDSVLRNPFPENKLPNLQSELDDAGFSPFDLVNISARFFGSIGFENLTENFMHDHFIEMEPGSGGPDCKSRIFDFGEIEMNYCPKVYYKKLLQTHGDVSTIQYALAKNNLSVGLNQEASPGFGNALGEAVILSVSTPKHLQQRLGLLKDYEYDDLLNTNRLYRLAVHSLLTIPTYFVHEKLWVDIINKNISIVDINCHYWNLMQKYMGVGKPVENEEGSTYDMPYKFYEGIVDQFRSTKKIFGEFLGYQIYRAVCLNIGEYQRGNAYKTLDNCDLAGNKQVGHLLNEMMSAGSSKPWREIIKPLTVRKLTHLTGTAFIEYYNSINEWLSEDNLSKNLQVGWTATDRCTKAQ
ncbi:angiotensin-converting enzyme-like [Teleopsis dalmanni]|uniref:angiotensin-converting enzyme-like n=2 Tax=Teleopsis dalmanni TaxID=139649 RepID=UPI0018CD4F49|nr:angiotensin-converting enzyme-like [Teleopsis dalmanni]